MSVLSLSTNLADFHHATENQRALALIHSQLELPFTTEWQDHYMPKLIELWKKPKDLYHVIAVGPFAIEILNWRYFEWTGISCKCECDRLEKSHIHMIGYIPVNRGIKQRFYKSVMENYGLKTIKRSSNYHKVIELRNVQHIISAFLYISMEQRVYKKQLDVTCKHSDFLPFGLTKFAKYLPEKSKVKSQHWQYFYETLSLAGYEKEVILCQEIYKAYAESKNANFKNKALGLKRTLPGTSGSVTEPISKRARTDGEIEIPSRTSLSENDIQLMQLIRNDSELGINLCDTETASRIICFLRQNPSQIVEGLRQFIITQGPKEKNSVVNRPIQHREELSSEELNSECVDNGDD